MSFSLLVCVFFIIFFSMQINDITEKIIGASYDVMNTLGSGFLEKVYENALKVELELRGLSVESQKKLEVQYKKHIVGEYYADLFVENEVVVELKSAKNLLEIHEAQLLNYLTATNKKIGILINFGKPRVEIKRVVNG